MLGRTPFATKEATRNLARRVRLLEVIDGQREKVLARLGRLRADDGRENDGVIDIDDNGTRRLAGDLARLEANVVLPPLEFFDDFIEHRHGHSFSLSLLVFIFVN